jgi:hypothetical protein
MSASVLQQAKIQAQVLVPLVKALQAELGTERANAIAPWASRSSDSCWIAAPTIIWPRDLALRSSSPAYRPSCRARAIATFATDDHEWVSDRKRTRPHFSTRFGPGVRDEIYVIGQKSQGETGTGKGSGGFLRRLSSRR